MRENIPTKKPHELGAYGVSSRGPLSEAAP
jgi:hypothetical protein